MGFPKAKELESIEIELLRDSSPLWIELVLENFDDFLVDHAACERKASATAVQFVVKYPDRPELVEPMIRLAREELLHFHQVARLVQKRNLSLRGDERDPYVNALLKEMRNGRDEHFLDRLLCFGLIERRGTERFGLVAKHITEPSLKDFYEKLTEAEARHHLLFTQCASLYFSREEIESRLQELSVREAEIVRNLPLRAAVH